MKTPIWLDANTLIVNDIKFLVQTGQDLYNANTTDIDTFVLGKSRRQIDNLQDLEFAKPVSNICELGIYKGGSVALYNELFEPKKLLAFDLNPEPVKPLEAYTKSRNLEARIKCFYGTNQADCHALKKAITENLNGELFDLVIDDASHLLEPTTKSFNSLFPYLAPGGYYIIEDWGWAHWNKPQWQENGGVWPKEPPLTNLIFEMTMMMASRPDLIESVFLLPAYAVVKKAKFANITDKNNFSIAKHYLNRGRKAELLT